MRRTGSLVTVVLLSAVGVLLLGACGTLRAGSDGAATAPTTPTESERWQTFAPIRVTAARLADDRRSLSVDAEVPGRGKTCVRDVKAVVTDTSDRTVWVQVTYSALTGSSPRSDCRATATATAKVRLPSPLGHRVLSVDNFTAFTADGADPPHLRLCGELGCHPAPTGCTSASYDQAVMALDVPNHTSRGDEHCDGKWLVFDVSSRMGPACPEGAGPGCGASLADRWFFRAEKSGWQPIARSTKAGCTDVHGIEPAFPPPCAPTSLRSSGRTREVHPLTVRHPDPQNRLRDERDRVGERPSGNSSALVADPQPAADLPEHLVDDGHEGLRPSVQHLPQAVVEACAEPRHGCFEAARQPLPTAAPGSGNRLHRFAGPTYQFGRDEQPLAWVVASRGVVEGVGDRVAAGVDLFRRHGGPAAVSVRACAARRAPSPSVSKSSSPSAHIHSSGDRRVGSSRSM